MVNEGGGESLRKILKEGDDDEEDGPCRDGVHCVCGSSRDGADCYHGCDHSDALGGHLAPQSWDEGLLSFR